MNIMLMRKDAIKDGLFTTEDNVVISENASSMGGSQVYLNTGETYKVKDLKDNFNNNDYLILYYLNKFNFNKGKYLIYNSFYF